MQLRPASLLRLAILLPLALAACDGSGSFRPSPTAPAPSPPPSRLEWVTYVGDASVASAATPPCGWWGDNTTVWWEIAVDGSTIQLDEEMEIVFTGTIEGLEFVAEWQAPPDWSSACPVLESTIAGTFSEDRRQLEALETTRWGPKHRALTTERRWSLSRSGA